MTALAQIPSVLSKHYQRMLYVPLALILVFGGASSSLAETVYLNNSEIKTSGFRYPFPEPLPEPSKPLVTTPSVEPSIKPLPVSAAATTFSYPSNQYPSPRLQPATTLDTPPISAEITSSLPPPKQPETEILPPITARVAIIIDDIGYSLKQGLRTARFPAPLTLAVLPHTPNGLALAELGFEEGKAIMLHAPMSNVKQSQLDPGGLTEDMGEDEFISTLRANIEAVPHIIGINNHMGSYLTQLSEPMNWLMKELKRQQLFFVDSRTSADSQAWEVAQQHGLSSHKRDVFLDHERNDASIEKQFERLVQLAKRRGSALAIGHPYPETLAVLEREIPKLRRLGIELVSIERLLPDAPTAQAPARANTLATSEQPGPPNARAYR